MVRLAALLLISTFTGARADLNFSAMSEPELQEALKQMRPDCALVEGLKKSLFVFDATLSTSRIQCSGGDIREYGKRDQKNGCFAAYLLSKKEFCANQYVSAGKAFSDLEIQVSMYSKSGREQLSSSQQKLRSAMSWSMGRKFCKCPGLCDKTNASILQSIRGALIVSSDLRNQADGFAQRCAQAEKVLAERLESVRVDGTRRFKEVREHQHVLHHRGSDEDASTQPGRK